MIEKYKLIQPIGYKILKKLTENNHFAHAYIIETNGFDGGYEFGLTLAKIILCQTNNNKNIIKAIENNNYPELKIINPDGTVIKKEQLLELQEEFNKKSIVGKNKVYIINEAEKLNVASSNTILKFLEEPSEGIVAILITKNVYELLETIISRCQIISLNGQITINEKKTTFEKIGDILLNDTLSYEEFIHNEKNKEKLESLINFIKFFEKNNNKILIYMNEYWFNYFNDKESISNALLILIYFYKDVLNKIINCKVDIFVDYNDFIDEIKKNNTVDRLIKKINIINKNRGYLMNNANLNLLMDKIIIEVNND